MYILQADPEFDLDIKEDVEEECNTYGRVKHIYVDKYVLIWFESTCVLSFVWFRYMFSWMPKYALFLISISLIKKVC